MSSLFNCMLRLFQYYGIFFGFTYIYIDKHKRLVKFHNLVKYYVYLVNFIYASMMLYYFIDLLQYINSSNTNVVIQYAFGTLHFVHMLIFAAVIMLRFKEENALRKWLEIFMPLQLNYFNKLTTKTVNVVARNIHILKIFILFAHSCNSLISSVQNVIEGRWWYVMESCLENYFTSIQHYLLIHHGFILCYIDYYFSILNNHLQYRKHKIEEPFANMYLKVSKLLQQVNSIYGPVVFFILFYQVVEISFYVYSIIEILLNTMIIEMEYSMELLIFTFLCIDLVLYFVICERVYRITKDTGRILKEYGTQNLNREVCIFSVFNFNKFFNTTYFYRLKLFVRPA